MVMDDNVWGLLGSPEGQGLLAAVATGLAGARRGRPLNTIGSGLLGGLQGYSNAQNNALNQARENTANQLVALQLKQAQQQADDQQAVRDLAPQFVRTPAQLSLARGASIGDQPSAMDEAGNFKPITKNVGPTPGNLPANPSAPAQFDQGGFINALMAKNPMLAMQMRATMAKEVPIDKVKAENFTPESLARFAQTGNYGDLVTRDKLENVNGAWSNPYTGKTVSVGAQDPNKPFMFDANGKIVPNTGYQQFALSEKQAGRPLTQVQVNNKMGESVAQQVGPIMKESYESAGGAQTQLGVADRLIKAIDSGNVFTGPGASLRLRAAQLGQSLGIGGNSSAEAIANTRATIQGLAQSTLSARSQLKGQGQVSDYEGKLIQRAASGDIDEMTAPEIKQLAQVNQRLSQQVIAQHNARVSKLRGNEATAAIADMYELPSMQQADNQPSQSVGSDLQAAAAAELARRRKGK